MHKTLRELTLLDRFLFDQTMDCPENSQLCSKDKIQRGNGSEVYAGMGRENL